MKKIFSKNIILPQTQKNQKKEVSNEKRANGLIKNSK